MAQTLVARILQCACNQALHPRVFWTFSNWHGSVVCPMAFIWDTTARHQREAVNLCSSSASTSGCCRQSSPFSRALMMAKTSKGTPLEKRFRKLAKLDSVHLSLFKQMAGAYGGAFYGMDLLAFGALNRSKAQIAGFKVLVRSKNLICAGAILRLQLDTALRFYASFLVAEPHKFALDVTAGKRIQDIKDMDGHKMRDAYLVKQLGKVYEWVPRVYERTSGYVHFSSVHIISAITRKPGDDSERKIEIKMSAKDKVLPPELYVEIVDTFIASTEILLTYVHGWVFSKSNPELLAETRQARGWEPL
jgi:hypothetical protein